VDKQEQLREHLIAAMAAQEAMRWITREDPCSRIAGTGSILDSMECQLHSNLYHAYILTIN
jgi:hypothetical protein